MKPRLLIRDAVIALSLANLLFLRRWAELFTIAGPKSYYLKITLADIEGTLLALVAVAAAIFAVAQIRHAGSRGRQIAAVGFFLLLVVLANQVGMRKKPGLLGVILGWPANPAVAMVQLLASVTVLSLAVRFWSRTQKLATTALLLLSPFVIVTVGRAAWYARTGELERFADRAPPLSAAGPSEPGPRVVLLLFDAMGRALAFDHRPAGVRMPAFDRLRAESLDAIAVQRAGEHTREAVPGMLSGVQPLNGRPAGASELLLELPGGRVESWIALPNVFRSTRAAGGVTTIAGWYHPYCRLFAPDLDGCASYPGSTAGGQVEWTVRASFFSALRATSPFTAYRDRHVRGHLALLRDAKRAVSRPGGGLTYVHLPVPHSPAIWDREDEVLTVLNFSADGYEAQLELADRTLAALRTEMETSGTWASSAVLVVSDHPSASATRRYGLTDIDVPFLLKLPGQEAPVTYSRRFSAATASPLVEALVRGEIATPAQAADWLDAHAIPPDRHVATATTEDEE